jgi:hypothetical protein
VGGSPLYRYEAGSELDSRLAAATLANAKAAPIQAILRAFKLDDATLWRVRRRLEQSGVSGLLPAKKGSKGPRKLHGPVITCIVALRRKGHSKVEIARRLGMSDTSVLRALRRAGEESKETEDSDEATPLPFEAAPIPAAELAVTPEETALDSDLAHTVEAAPSTTCVEGSLSQASAGMEETPVVAVVDEGSCGLTSVASAGTSGPAPIPAAERAATPEEAALDFDRPPTVEAAPSTTCAEGSLSQASVGMEETPVVAVVDEGSCGLTSAASASTFAPVLIPASKRAATPKEAVLYAILGFSFDGEAEVVFEPRVGLPCAGFLLAIPALVATGLLEAGRKVYGRLKPGVYGLRAAMLVLAMIALLRRPRPEHLKGGDPTSLGDVIGLLRAPEVKTVRRKLAEVAHAKKAHLLMEELARRWLAAEKDELGTLYIDGHVRDYHGKRTLPKAHISQRNLCAPATTDYWVNGVHGEPVFVVTAEANAAMTQMLLPVIDKAEEYSSGRKGTIVFDRGGWSPDLFKKIREKQWHILTYRKGKIDKHPLAGFKEQSLVIDGKKRRYTLSERTVRLRNGLKLREIAELRDDGGQTIILTSDFDHPAVLLAYRMFERWRQENYFRYMKENFALDALVDYGVEADNPNREVPNPAWKALDKKLTLARAALAKCEREYGAAAATNPESQRPTMRGFKIANSEIGQALRAAKKVVEELKHERDQLPERVTVAEAIGGDEVVKLSTERKLFTDMIKTACYRAESGLLRLLEPHFSRSEDEGRAFLQAAMRQPGDVLVNGDDVIIRFAPMSAPRFTAALAALCEDLNSLKPRFPETTYRLHYEVAEAAK